VGQSKGRRWGVVDPSDSWLIGSTKGLAVVIAVLVAVIFVSGGIALFAHAVWWRPLTIAGLAASLALDVLYFNPVVQLHRCPQRRLPGRAHLGALPSERLVGV